ncbi:hypothetical protein BUALT_Bualt14G0032500 [Buddleja alternifolia]|uniref:BED-type domain-containing protein n=1 Tax=Buddleja alternifolia TaxID=168488 RepID=A0AAV6WP32_9LAMI|nr:hypothetical protein BUALT_Bualt14G0032500 [Buddleja alternifolia]
MRFRQEVKQLAGIAAAVGGRQRYQPDAAVAGGRRRYQPNGWKEGGKSLENETGFKQISKRKKTQSSDFTFQKQHACHPPPPASVTSSTAGHCRFLHRRSLSLSPPPATVAFSTADHFRCVGMSTSESSQPSHVGGPGSNEEVTNQPQGTKRKVSFVWKHFIKVRVADNVRQAKCIHCGRLMAGNSSSGTTHLKKHLENACPNKLDLGNIRVGGSSVPKFLLDQLKSRNEMAIACIKHKFAFNKGEYEFFETLLNGLNPNFQLPCRNTIRADVISIRGLLQKIRETARYLKKSPSATQKFKTAWDECNLKDKRKVEMDVPNRWNSTYELFKIALPLKEAFCRLQRIEKQYLFNPSESEWEVATIYLEIIDWGRSEHDFLRGMAGPMKEKFDKYWDKCCLVLSIAVVFDRSHVSLAGDRAIASSSNTCTDGDDYERWFDQNRDLVDQKSEWESFLDEPRYPKIENFSILDRWRTSSPRLPILAKIARDVLAVLATTVASEEAFIVGGRVIDESR